jgi:hypothetical protein
MGDPNGNPDVRDAALRSALERLVLLECRVQDTPGPTAGSAELELSRWRAEAQRAEARAASAEAQRDRLFGRLIAAERTQASLSGEPAGADLASFIAELRAELGKLELARDAAEAQRAELLEQLRERERAQTAEDSPSGWAKQLSDRGLLPDPGATLASLERDLVFGSSAERALLKGVMRDLSAPDSAGTESEVLREAAAERLASLPAALSAPVFAAALSREASPAVLAKLIRGAGLTRVASLGPLLAPLRDHADPRVRAAILFAEVRLTGTAPSDAWLKDADPRVRRRAALAVVLRAPSDAETILTALIGDKNPGVRQAVAAGAAALPQPPATLLLRMAQDVEVRVRRAALRALSAPQSLADLPAADRRKALREILRMQAEGTMKDSGEDAGATAQGPGPTAPGDASRVPMEESGGRAQGPGPTGPSPSAGASASPDLDAIDQELRSSLRGLTPEQLAQMAGVDVETLNRTLRASENRFVMRGPRWFAR